MEWRSSLQPDQKFRRVFFKSISPTVSWIRSRSKIRARSKKTSWPFDDERWEGCGRTFLALVAVWRYFLRPIEGLKPGKLAPYAAYSRSQWPLKNHSKSVVTVQ